MYRIGVDVGGTNTDAAILDITAADTPNRGVLATCKSATTADITTGIASAIATVLSKSGFSYDKTRAVQSVTIGTTHFVNALVEADQRRLSRVAAVRLCGPFTRQLPPFADFPLGLRRVVDGGTWYLDGGVEIDGREIAPLDKDQIRECVEGLKKTGVRAIALTGVFAPLDRAQEFECRRLILQLDPGLDIVCSGDIGPPGLLERENATILNAAILATARRTIRGFRRAMRRLQLTCPLYLSQNDGTLIDADAAARFPIKTFASGPTNSMTGAAFLAGLDKPRSLGAASEGGGDETSTANEGHHQVLVVDIGGTTTDVCALLPSGFPRQAPNFVEVGGVRTAFSMPEVVSIGLGGGSKIGTDPSSGEVMVGPDSVGHLLTEEALVFGGPTLTASDIVVASGAAKLGDRAKTEGIPKATVDAARGKMRQMLEAVIERMKVSAAPVHVLLVGGGSLLVPEDDGLANVARCVKPVHHDAANAVGAAIAKVSGEVDVIEILDGRDERAIVESACRRAVEEAVRKGASSDDVNIVAVEKIPLQYTSNKATRLIVKAVGRLAATMSTLDRDTETSAGDKGYIGALDELDEDKDKEEGVKTHIPDVADPAAKPSLKVDLNKYRPDVRDGVWYLSEVDLELIATGTGVLGTGGGGPSYHEFLRGLDVLRNGGGVGKMRVVSPGSLADSDMVVFGSWYGAPSVINERLAGGEEISLGIEAVRRLVGIEAVQAVLTDEIGGGNGMSGFPTGVKYDIPVVDGDAMGRAYPTMYHSTLYINGNPITPCALTDARGNVAVVMVRCLFSVDHQECKSYLQTVNLKAESPVRVETMLRTTAVELGLGCAVCARPLSGDVVKRFAVPNTISQAWNLGQAVHLARRNKTSLTDAIFATTAGELLFKGKIVDVRRDIGGGYTMGRVLIAPLEADEQEDESVLSPPSTATSTSSTTTSNNNLPQDRRSMVIPFQNEYLYAAYADAYGDEHGDDGVVCTVPDLISILGQDGEAIGSQDLRYGLRVSVIGMPAHPLWKTEEGLKVGGPEGFGLRIPFRGVGEYTPPRSVIEEYGGGV